MRSMLLILPGKADQLGGRTKSLACDVDKPLVSKSPDRTADN